GVRRRCPGASESYGSSRYTDEIPPRKPAGALRNQAACKFSGKVFHRQGPAFLFGAPSRRLSPHWRRRQFLGRVVSVGQSVFGSFALFCERVLVSDGSPAALVELLQCF